jgi:hypothetical protein
MPCHKTSSVIWLFFPGVIGDGMQTMRQTLNNCVLRAQRRIETKLELARVILFSTVFQSKLACYFPGNSTKQDSFSVIVVE